MKTRFLLMIGIAAFTLCLAGCGGGGGSKGSSFPTRSPYEGEWTGTSECVRDEYGGIPGTCQVTVDDMGNFTGSMVTTSTGATQTITGTISDNGEVTGQMAESGAIGSIIDGTAEFGEPGHMQLSVICSWRCPSLYPHYYLDLTKPAYDPPIFQDNRLP